ncbi:MAG: PilZ domain-containing protein [Candidatus Sulfotelmatobacter sp.]
MQAVSFPARQARAQYRHELRTLTYVTLDDANGGIIRNLNHEGVAVQAVAALRPQQRVRLRFELRFPRLRVETGGQVLWASRSGRCGIRFVDLPTRTHHQINEWIFSNLLDAMAREADHPRSIFGASVASIARKEKVREENLRDENAPEENDGLTVSAAPRPAIRLEPGVARQDEAQAAYQNCEEDLTGPAYESHASELPGFEPNEPLNWLSRPLSGRTLAWLVDSLVVLAALLLFALIFISIAHELPPWPLTLGTASAAAVFVAAAYWAIFAVFGGPSLGARLAQTPSSLEENEEEAVRIR